MSNFFGKSDKDKITNSKRQRFRNRNVLTDFKKKEIFYNFYEFKTIIEKNKNILSNINKNYFTNYSLKYSEFIDQINEFEYINNLSIQKHGLSNMNLFNLNNLIEIFDVLIANNNITNTKIQIIQNDLHKIKNNISKDLIIDDIINISINNINILKQIIEIYSKINYVCNENNNLYVNNYGNARKCNTKKKIPTICKNNSKEFINSNGTLRNCKNNVNNVNNEY